MSDQAQIEKLMQQAEECLARGAHDEAAEHLAEAYRIDPLDPDPPLLSAMIHFKAGRLGQAAVAVLQAIRNRPFHPTALNLLAVICADAGYRTDAKRILSRLRRDVPGFKPAKKNLKQIRGLKGNAEPIAGFPVEEARLDRSNTGLSVCISVSDGETGLENTIDSIRTVADQIVLVNATSEGTLSKFDMPGLTVVESTPSTDRAALLNQALRRANRGWVLVLKPGETLASSSLGKLGQALEHTRVLFHEVRVEGTGRGTRLAARLFRNAPGVIYSGSVLPSIRPALNVLAREWRLGSACSGVTLHRASDAEDHGIDQAMIAAACHELKANPENAALVLQFARLAAQSGDAEQALKAFEIMDPRFIDPEELAVSTVRCLLRLGRVSDARKAIDLHHGAHPPTRNTLYFLGAIAGAVGEPSMAANALSKCSRLPPKDSIAAPLPELSSAALPNLLGASLLELGRYDEAVAAFESALNLEPQNVEARMGLLSLNMARGEFETLLHQLDHWIDQQGDDPRVWSYGSLLLGRIPDLAIVHAQWATEACRRFPDDVSLRRQRVEAHLSCGQIDSALEILSDSTLDSPADLAARWAASLAAGVDPPRTPSGAREEIEAKVLLWLQLWLSQKHLKPLDRALLRIPEWSTELPGLPALTANWLEQVGQSEAASRVLQPVAV